MSAVQASHVGVDGFARTLGVTVFEERVTRLERMVGITTPGSAASAQASQHAPDQHAPDHAHQQGDEP
jgi:hypothetical protein